MPAALFVPCQAGNSIDSGNDGRLHLGQHQFNAGNQLQIITSTKPCLCSSQNGDPDQRKGAENAEGRRAKVANNHPQGGF